MPPPNIRAHLKSLIGENVETITGHANRIVRIDDTHVYVVTGRTRAQSGEAIEIAALETAARRLWRDGELLINTDSVGYRSAFVGAALGALPGVEKTRRPARLLLSRQPGTGQEANGTKERWWTAFAQERYWLEVSDREHFGEDLRAPADQRTSHVLVRAVNQGDVVFHYDKRRRAVIGWSEVIATFRRVAGEYRAQLGGMLGVALVSLARLREFDGAIREIAGEMEAQGYDMRGFPFERSRTRAIRPLPAYLSKLPVRIVEEIPELVAAADMSTEQPRRRSASQQRRVAGSYRSANEGVTIPLIRSAETVAWRAELAAQRTERSTREHNRLQNRLERFLRAHGVSTLSPEGDVPFDLAWSTQGGLAFAEIKSLATSQSQRLRLGLGQALYYRHTLRNRLKEDVTAFLVIPRAPDDPAWPMACAEAGVRLVWPATFPQVLSPQ